ncbi:MAG TPA: outer membrane beta-barrel protein [Burkholderiales bacterium]
MGGAALLAMAALPAYALDTKFAYRLGYDTGGDTFIAASFSGGGTDKIKANQGFFFGGGASIVNDAKDIETEITLSYKVDEIVASNGDFSWTRWPVEALLFYRWPTVRLGGGLTYHLNPHFEGSALGISVNSSFKNALGFVLQADWRLVETVNLGLRYTTLDYELEGSGVKFNSDGFGIVLSGSF